MMSSISQKNVLIVDDDYNFRESLIIALNDEYSVLDVGEGKRALELIKKDLIDIVILDIKLPDIDGIEVLRQIRKVDGKLPVILITAYGTKEIAIKSIKLHVDDYFDKPINIKELKRSIKSLLKLKEDFYNFKEYPLDIEKRLVKIKDILKINKCRCKLYDIAKEVGLTPKHLSRLFKNKMGKNFTKVCIQQRMYYAKQLLKNTNLTISEIAQETGYSYWSNFTRRFIKEIGYSPIEYRKNMKK
jgi:YesN/AraC family two-component response regulator